MNIAYGLFKPPSVSQTNQGTVSVNNLQQADVADSTPIIDIHVQGSNLKKMDIGSESDPMCVLMIPQKGKYVEVARTEVIWDNPNPQWVKTLKAMYIFETCQPLRFMVYDCDSENADLSKHDFIGYCDTDVQSIVSHIGHELKIKLKKDGASDERGSLVIIGEQAANSNSHATIDVQVKDLKRMRTFSRNWPYLVISKPSESGANLPSYRSEVVRKCSSCRFRAFTIPLQALCNGDLDAPLILSIYDYKEGKVDKLIGSTQLSLTSLMETQNTWLRMTDKKNKKVGEIKFNSIQITQKPTFLDYLKGGLQLNMITAIDFTASNRDVRDPNSLHFLSQQPNQYETCIWSVGSVLCPYDTDQQFPVYGFGGKVGGIVNHCFPLTFNPANPNVIGLQGIIGAYKNSLMQVQLSGPTLFAPVIKAATEVARQAFDESRTYTILMILTDGIINDMNQTKDAIVAATDAPLSIIIVGVGPADFTAMDVLDADDEPLRSTTGKVMARDIVQFVPFRDFANIGGAALAASVLEEVPRQVDEFCRANGFVPTMTTL
jgi:hypothetical protein